MILKLIFNMFNGRGKNKIQKPLTINHSYTYYLKGVKEESKYNIDWKLYKLICGEFNKRIMKAIIEDGYFFKMPYRLGTIRIRKKENKLHQLRRNWGLYNTSNGEIKNKYLNEHTDNQYVRFYWNKLTRDSLVKNKTIYSFIPTRENKRYLSKLLKEYGIEQINKYFE